MELTGKNVFMFNRSMDFYGIIRFCRNIRVISGFQIIGMHKIYIWVFRKILKELCAFPDIQ